MVVPYAPGGGPQQQLDLYVPTEHKNEPLIVFVHGGGWEHGDKAGDRFVVGQTWQAVSDNRQIEVVTRNAEGETLIGYQDGGGTSLVTEAEFADWVRDEVALRA